MKTFGIAIAAILMVYLGICVCTAVMVVRIPRIPLEESPASVGLSYEDISFPSRTDDIVLKGWYMPGGKVFTVIIVNGGWRNRVDPNVGTLELCRDLVARGYNVLVFDMRGRGESDGKGLVLTHTERDIGGAVDYIKSGGCPAENIGIIGFSTGAASSLIFASQEDVAAVVSDGCFAEVHEMVVRQAVSEKSLPELLVRLFIPGVFLTAKTVYGCQAIDPVDKVADVTCPILFIHGQADRGTPVEDVYRLLKASGNPLDRLWVMPGAEHCQAYKTDPAGYVDIVAGFFDRLERDKLVEKRAEKPRMSVMLAN